MRSWASSRQSDSRPTRKNYRSFGVNDAAGLPKDIEWSKTKAVGRRRETECFTWLAVIGCFFLIISLASLAFFLSSSDLKITKSSSKVDDDADVVIVLPTECKVDSDCDSCCSLLRGEMQSHATLSLNPCLLPANRSRQAVCENECCVPAPPEFAPEGTPCDDGKWCTYDDRCHMGECKGVQRNCQDADFCTVEECSETFRTCVSGTLNDPLACEQTCFVDEDCRSEFYCMPSGLCGRLPDTDATLRFTHYEIERCHNFPGEVFSMTQHYVTYEKAYLGPQGEARYRVVDRVKLPLPPHDYNEHVPAFDPSAEGVPLVEVYDVSETRIVVLKNDTYAQTTITMRTACQEMNPYDMESCATVWLDRQYDFEVVHKDCVGSGGESSAFFHDCLPSNVPRPYTMFLSVIDCPLVDHTVKVVPLPSLWFESPFAPGVALHELLEVRPVRALLRTDHSNWLDPFLINATVCTLDPNHRLSGCAANDEEKDCPIRGCHGWSPNDTPVVRTRVYMVESEWTAEAGLDNVEFCRNKLKYDEGGCLAGECNWGNFTGQDMAALGGVDGFEFTPLDSAGAVIVVDVSARLEYCSDPHKNNRRLSTSSAGDVARFIGTIKLKDN